MMKLQHLSWGRNGCRLQVSALFGLLLVQPVLCQPIRMPRDHETILKTAFDVEGIHVGLQAPTEGFVLSSLAYPDGTNINPYYHASGLLFTVPELTIDSILSVRLRLSAEAQNFSEMVGDERNSVIWARPNVTVRIPVGWILDSVRVSGGDLWRIKSGQGMNLDYFEALGSNFRLVFGDFGLELTTAGVGWTYFDDIKFASVDYDSLVRFNAFWNQGGGRTYDDFQENVRFILSVDAQINVGPFRVYAEVGKSIYYGFAGMAGLDVEHSDSWYTVGGRLEYRRYSADYFPTASPYSWDYPYPYLKSLTALDKPVMTYRDFVYRTDALYAQVYGYIRFYKNFIVGTNTELFDELYTDSYIGWRFNDLTDITIGYLNKLFNDPGTPYAPADTPMFRQEGMVIIRARYRL